MSGRLVTGCFKRDVFLPITTWTLLVVGSLWVGENAEMILAIFFGAD